MSHACPQCRTILFPEPKYKVKQSEMPEDYAEQLDALRIQRKRLTILSNSVAWFQKEIELQRQFEDETGVA